MKADRMTLVVPVLTDTHVNPPGSAPATIEVRRLSVASGIVVIGRRAMTLDFWLKITANR